MEKEWCEAGEALQKLHEVGRDEDSPANGHYASKAVYDSRVELDEVLTANGIEEDVATELNGKHYGEIEVSSLLHANFTEGRNCPGEMLYTWANLEADWLGLSMDCVECAAFGPGGGRNTRKNPCYWC